MKILWTVLVLLLSPAAISAQDRPAIGPPGPYDVLSRNVDSLVMSYARANALRGVMDVVLVSGPESEKPVTVIRSTIGKQETDSIAARLRAAIRADAKVRTAVPVKLTFADSVFIQYRPATPTAPKLNNRAELQREFTQEIQRLRLSSGRMDLMFRINPHGDVEDMQVLSSNGGALLNSVSKYIASHAHFTPCKLDGVPFSCLIRLPFVAVVR
jgi:hypothetical protein